MIIFSNCYITCKTYVKIESWFSPNIRGVKYEKGRIYGNSIIIEETGKTAVIFYNSNDNQCYSLEFVHFRAALFVVKIKMFLLYG